MNRVDGVVALHRTLHGKSGRPRQHVSDMLRGALVLAVGALDGLVLEAVLEAIGPAARAGRLGEAATKWAKDDPEKVLRAFSAADPHHELTQLARNHLGQITFQSPAMIEGVLRDVAAVPAPWSRASLALTDANDKWSQNRVKEELRLVVERRHRIAHAGDLRRDAMSARPITVSYVQEASALIRCVGLAVCDEVDDLLRDLRRQIRV